MKNSVEFKLEQLPGTMKMELEASHKQNILLFFWLDF
jgi:hypothetical protein